ncbi:hypothetical protein [Novosphingobium profundi]|nr:hypothetical protein [Novosphingobium profundi]
MFVPSKSRVNAAIAPVYWEVEVMCAVFAGAWLMGIWEGLQLLR